MAHQSAKKERGIEITRRSFLSLTWWGVAGLVLLQGLVSAIWALWPTKKSAFTESITIGGVVGGKAAAGNVNDLQVGQVGDFHERKLFVVRTEDGILAIHNKCPHLGCAVPWRKDLPARSEDPLLAFAPKTDSAAMGRFHCPCHGSQYDRLGVIREGPAPRPLDYIDPEAVTIDGEGNIVVDTSNPIQRKTFQPSQVKKV